MAGQQTQYAPVYTGNNVYIVMNYLVIAFVETLSISRSVNRRPVYQVGGPLYVDAPVTQSIVNVTATNLVPLQGGTNPGVPLSQVGVVPSASLADQVYAGSFDLAIYDAETGQARYYVKQAHYNNDAVQVPGTDVFTLNCSWIARDSMIWT